MRVVLDANIFISYLLYPYQDGPIKGLLTHVFEGGLTLLLPEPLLDEFLNKIPQKPYLSKRISAEDLAQFVILLNRYAKIIPKINEAIPAVTRDPKDDYLLAYAMVGAADYLITGDDDLLVLGQIGKLQIISPRDFYDKHL